MDDLITEAKRLGIGGRATWPCGSCVGKKMGSTVYLHRDYASVLPQAKLKAAEAKLPDDFDYTVIKHGEGCFSFIHSPDFDEADEPTVGDSYKVAGGKATLRRAGDDPMIYHHKWSFVGEDYDGFDVEESVRRSIAWKTIVGKDATLSSRIGRKSVWESEVLPKLMDRTTALYATEAALTVASDRVYWHTVTGSVQEIRALLDSRPVKRHKTAIKRKDLSMPIKSLMKKGMLTKDTSLFDYGCGRGDDLRLLGEKGYNVAGWDPYYAPKNKRKKADIVNLGFVLNVIEDADERAETLQKAFALAKGVLVVSTRPTMKHKFKAYNDGFITGSDTFQKFWAAKELKSYLQDTLGIEPVSGGSCVFYCFKNDKARESMMG